MEEKNKIKLEYVTCPLCSKDSYGILYESVLSGEDALKAEDLACTNVGHCRHHRIVKCNGCGMIYSNPRDPSDIIRNFYSEVIDNKYCENEKRRKVTFKRVLGHIEKYKKRGKLLDVGCYTGLFMETAKSGGWDTLGVEPSKWAVSIGQKKGFDIIAGDIYTARDKINRKFDVITMWDVLEHVSDPVKALNICYEKLKDNGILGVSTMRCEGLFYSICGRRWPWFMRMHLSYFTLETLSGMLDKAGFRLIASYPYIQDMDLNYLFYKLTWINKNFAKLARSRILSHIIIPVCLRDVMEVYAKKK